MKNEKETRELIKPGNKIKLFYHKGNFNNKTIHILAIVKDQVIFKTWLKHKKLWSYQIQSLYYFTLAFDCLNYIGKSK